MWKIYDNCSGSRNGYSACNKTLSTWNAANAACAQANSSSNFSNITKIRLPGSDFWEEYIREKAVDKMGWCSKGVRDSVYCEIAPSHCNGSQDGCQAYAVWTRTVSNESNNQHYVGFWIDRINGDVNDYVNNHGASGRCSGYW